MHVRKGDTVQVVAGDENGARGTVLSVDHGSGKVVIEGINRVYKHVKRGHPKSPQGGRLHVEMPIDASNVRPLCPETNEPTRIGVRILDDGSKERYAKKSGASMGQISPPKASRAKS